MTIASTPTRLEERLQAVLAAKSMLNHPFYVEWTQGVLPLERMQEYARQYYHFEAAFPRFLSAIHARTPDAGIRQLLLQNLWDEEYGERNHLALWLEFGEATGVDRDDVVNSTPRPETVALVEHFSRASRQAPLAEALGTLYAYEGQVPAVAEQKIDGLRRFYGLGSAQYEFFSVHREADVAHSGAEMQAIATCCEDEDALAGAVEAACDRLLAFLDGCYAKEEAPE